MANENSTNGTETVERKRRSSKQSRPKRIRLSKMMLAIRKAVPEYFERTGDSESAAQGWGVIRADIQDRVLYGLCHRVRLLEGWRNLGAVELPKKPIRNEQGLQVVRPQRSA
jgi:hypothetical protein